MKFKKNKIKNLKKVVFISFILVFTLLFSVNVLAVGAAPGKIIIDFKPGLETQFEINVLNIQEGTKLDISLEGDLKQYANVGDLVDNKLIVYLSLPEKLEKSGENIVFLRVTEIPADSKGIMGVTAVRVPIIIKVPYPGRYLEVDLEISDASVGKNIDFKITAENLGEEPLYDIKGEIKIYGPREELINSISIKDMFVDVASKEEVVVKGKIKKEGDYRAVVEMNYGGKIAKDEKKFKVGSLSVEIVKYDKWFKKGVINPFEIKIKNKWNDVIPGIYANILISSENNGLISEIQTPSINLGAWEEKTIMGFFDTINFESGIYLANITFYYLNQTTNKEIKISVDNKKLISRSEFIYSLFLIIFIGGYFYVRKRKMKLNIWGNENVY